MNLLRFWSPNKMYKLTLDRSVQKFMTKHTDVARLFYKKIPFLLADPYTAKLDIKPLQWYEKWNYRLRIGKYRFKYVVIDRDIVIYFYDADSRGDVYK